MKNLAVVFFTACTMLAGSSAIAAEHGFITSLMHDEPAEDIYRVNIEDINGKNANMGPNHHVHTGEISVTVSLVFNPARGTGMARTGNNIYYQTFTMTVEKGKTYYLGAKVNTHASAAEQADGSFWEPIIAEVH